MKTAVVTFAVIFTSGTVVFMAMTAGTDDPLGPSRFERSFEFSMGLGTFALFAAGTAYLVQLLRSRR